MSCLASVPAEDLDRELTDLQLASISKHLVEWPEKARGLGLEEGEIDDIKKDYSSSREQKRAMMRRWKEINGDRATLNSLLTVAEQKGWVNFSREVIKTLGYHVDGKSECSLPKCTLFCVEVKGHLWYQDW